MAHPLPIGVQQPVLVDLTQPIPIAPEANTCLSYLERICDALRILKPEEEIRIGVERITAFVNFQDAQAKYKAWGVSIAAFRSGLHPTSLDFRLRDAVDIRKRLSLVLEELREYLEDSTQIISGKRANKIWADDATSDSDSDEEGPEQQLHKTGKAPKLGDVESASEFQVLCSAIHTAIGNLMKLSILIRESSKRDDYAKAASRYSTWSPNPDISHVNEKYGSANMSSPWLLERLGTAITRRRQFLTYRMEHHGKLTGDWGEDIDVVVVETPDKIREGKKPAKSIAPTQATTFIPDTFTPEKDGSDIAGSVVSVGSQTSYEATEFAREDGPTKLTVPPPPKWAFPDVPFEYGEPFQCPVCYTEQKVKNKNAWKKHVFRDLKPYVCTFPSCAMRMFHRRNEWFAHELQCHRRQWVCQFCQNDPLPTAEEFSEHVATIHPAILAGSKMEAMILQSEEPVTKILSKACPLCNEWETGLRDSNQDSKILLLNGGRVVEPYGTTKQFRKHLGRHMEQLALFALPVKESNELEDESVDGQEENDTDSGDQEDLLEHEISLVPPPPPPGFRLPGPPSGGPGPEGFPMQMQMPIRQQSSRITDITPPKIMDEAACLRKLTTYRVFTIQKAPPRDPKIKKATWARAEVGEEEIPQEEIVKQIKKLNAGRRTVTDKKAALAPFQQGQINNLLDEQESQEHDRNFEWSLAQLNTITRSVSPRTGKMGQLETVTISVYLKRTPLRDLNPAMLLQAIERSKAESLRLQPPPGVILSPKEGEGGGGKATKTTGDAT